MTGKRLHMDILFAGCYGTKETRHGMIHTIELDETTGRMRKIWSLDHSVNPSFLAFHGNRLYAVNETDKERDSRVDGYLIQPNGTLTFLGGTPVPGTAVCHVSVFPDGRALALSSYGSGILSVCSLDAKGIPLGVSLTFRHKGHGPVIARQAGPHTHSSMFDRTGRTLFAADLGCDVLFRYCRDTDDALVATGKIPVPAGEGPRHMAFHPDNTFLYVVGEVGCHLMTYSFDELKEEMTLRGLSPLAEKREGSTAADIHLSSDGKWLWTTTRGEDTISTFSLEDPSKPRLVSRQSSGGSGPRNFCISSSGQYLLVANMGDGSLVSFRIEPGNELVETDRLPLPGVAFIGPFRHD
jgi:6-phosphogluconolactonase